MDRTAVRERDVEWQIFVTSRRSALARSAIEGRQKVGREGSGNLVRIATLALVMNAVERKRSDQMIRVGTLLLSLLVTDGK
jgi:hypothetical protein